MSTLTPESLAMFAQFQQFQQFLAIQGQASVQTPATVPVASTSNVPPPPAIVPVNTSAAPVVRTLKSKAQEPIPIHGPQIPISQAVLIEARERMGFKSPDSTPATPVAALVTPQPTPVSAPVTPQPAPVDDNSDKYYVKRQFNDVHGRTVVYEVNLRCVSIVNLGEIIDLYDQMVSFKPDESKITFLPTDLGTFVEILDWMMMVLCSTAPPSGELPEFGKNDFIRTLIEGATLCVKKQAQQAQDAASQQVQDDFDYHQGQIDASQQVQDDFDYHQGQIDASQQVQDDFDYHQGHVQSGYQPQQAVYPPQQQGGYLGRKPRYVPQQHIQSGYPARQQQHAPVYHPQQQRGYLGRNPRYVPQQHAPVYHPQQQQAQPNYTARQPQHAPVYHPQQQVQPNHTPTPKSKSPSVGASTSAIPPVSIPARSPSPDIIYRSFRD